MIDRPTYRVELAIDPAEANKSRGDALERLIASFLRQQSYTVVENLRNTGTEIDILAKHNISLRSIIVECKAQRANVQSAAIDGLFTDVHIKNVDEGWLITLGGLGREALGKLEEIQRGGTKSFTHITAHSVVDHIIKSGSLGDADAILSKYPSLSREVSLILTTNRMLYCFEHRSNDRQSTLGHSLVDAISLQPVANEDVYDLVSSTIDHYSEGKWLQLLDVPAPAAAEALPQAVVELAAGSDWQDYRPSRPEDFIGREETTEELYRFIEQVRLGKSRSRIFGIKAASGWGKSSLVLKAADRINATNSKIRVIAVDCRAAVSSDYPHLVLAKAFSDARLQGIEFWGLPDSLPITDRPFDNPVVANGLKAISSSKGLIVIVFDQFEEIIHSPNRALFARLENLCYQVDSLQIPILLGFSWRTDAMVSADNPGYNLWHRLSDRRKDIQLRAFTHADALTYIDRTERNSGVRLAAKDRRFLLDTYVGLPWLLKKLAVNMITDRATGRSIGDDTDPIRQIFDSDLDGLSVEDHACIRAVAAAAPVPIHSLALNFSEAVISGLIERRLLISAGGQLSLYSDIFRDYVLYKRLPKIPNTYCPYVSVPKLVQCISILRDQPTISYRELSTILKIAETSADNIARDLQQMNVVRLDRAGGIITSTHSGGDRATASIIDFLRRHIILETLDRDSFKESGADFDEIVENAVQSYRFSSLTRSTIQQYCAQILRLGVAVGLVRKQVDKFSWGRPIRDLVTEKPRPVRVTSRSDGFMGQAPPERVMKLLDEIHNGNNLKVNLKRAGLRNALLAAISLGLVRVELGTVIADTPITSIRELIDVAADKEFVAFAKRLLSSDPALNGREIGAKLAERYSFNLHPSSMGRYGNALKQWAMA